MLVNDEKYKILINSYNREYEILDISNGEIVEQSTSFIRIDNNDAYYSFAKGINHVSNIYYNITKICNLKCTYCYSDNRNNYVSIEDNIKILDKFKELNTRAITLIGGEPLCHPYINDILEEVLKRDYEEICIVTNGTRIKVLDINYLKDPRVHLQISLDGYNEETNTPTRGRGVFTIVDDNIAYLTDNGIQFRVMKVLTRDNIETSIEYFKYFYNKGIVPGFFMVKQVDESTKPTLKQIEELVMKIYDIVGVPDEVFNIIKFADNLMFDNTGFPIAHCGAGIISLSIDPNGNVYPCVKRTSKEELITNIFTKDSVEIIRKNRKNIIEEELVFKKHSCCDCNIRYFCGGGCRAEERNGDVCEYNCGYFKLAVDIYYKLKLRSAETKKF